MFDIRKAQEQKLFETVREASDARTAEEVVFGQDGSARGEADPDWVSSTMGRLERSFDEDTVKLIRRSCQCGYGMEEKLALLMELKSASSNMRELASSEKARAAGLSYQDDCLCLQFEFCPCPMLAQVEKLDSMTWCECSAGYSKQLFEKAFGCAVDVTMLKSVKCGDEICLMKIVPQEDIWERR